MSRSDARRAHPSRRIIWLTAGVLGVLLVGAVVWVGVRATIVRTELDAAVDHATALRAQLADSDFAGVADSADQLEKRAGAAAELTGDPVWRAAEVIPIVGPNLAAARIVSHQLVALTTGVIDPALAVSSDLSSISLSGGLDLGSLATASGQLEGALSVLQQARREVGSIDSSAIVGPLRDGVEELSAALAQAEPVLRDASLAAGVVPQVLGADGAKSILVMVQNGAEVRTGGGLTGTFAEIRADNGALQIVDQASSSDFPWLDEPITALPASVTSQFDDAVGRYVMNISSPADFSVSADLASRWWEMHAGHRPDTVVSVDVRVLGALLAVIGPVDAGDWGEITSDNVVQRLLVDPYMSLDAEAQDELFERVVQATFARALGSDLDAAALVRELSKPIEDGRVSLWTSDPTVQAVVDESALAGAAGRQEQAGRDAFAVYFNDITGGKMDPYLDVAIDARVTSCRPDGRRDITFALTMTNTAPADAAETFSASVTGNGRWGVAVADIGTLVAVSAPPGSFVGGATKDGEELRSTSGDAGGFVVTQARVNLSPGETNVLEFRFVAAEPGAIDPVILHTPLLDPIDVTQTAGGCV